MHKGFFRRLAALTRKETLELLRDQSSLLMGVVLPLILILIIGYGLSLDVKNVPTAVVLEDSSPTARQFVSFTQGSEYFRPVFMHSLAEAEQKMRRHEVSAILYVPQDFSRRLAQRDAQVQKQEQQTIAQLQKSVNDIGEEQHHDAPEGYRVIA